MRGTSSSSPTETLQPLTGSHGRSESPKVPAVDAQHKPNPAGDVVSAATPGTPPQIGQIPVNEVPIAPSSKTTASAPSVDEDGFTMVSKHNKQGPIKLQSKNQKPVRVKMHAQQYGPGRSRRNIVPNGPGENQKGEPPTAKQQATRVEVNKDPRVASIAPKKVTSGFNYSMVVQGSAKPTIGLGVESANRFSVLDIPSSIKFNKLIEGQDDLYPPDNGLEDGMDLEMNTLIRNEKVECSTNEKYGISDAQKQVILNCICDFKYVQAEAVEEWSQGEWDFFADKCMEMGLDPENSILYPEEDTEIEDVDDR
ncbi:hypothetical protein L1987_47746 [Smallanthus sonchifolius]|uniref:Uncharacterized protein n=1 Tax=Smallanthus sonchifolius TaxID=185202 RepID=A0ACB9G419_9ASTR|nr:hypothetical protein L1987_47746 [Smallanthus sonchifolius]